MNRLRSLAVVLLAVALGTVPTFANPAHQTDTVTHTFRLTIYGQVPPQTAFSVVYGDQANRAVRYFCGSIEGAPDCAVSSVPGGNGAIHIVDITWPRGTALPFAVRVHSGGSENGTTFYEATVTPNGNTTTDVSFSFAPTSPQPAPSTPPTPPRLPDTGLPGLPLGGLAVGAICLASGVLLRKRR